MKTIKLVWNGCDSYIESAESVFTTREEFKPFKAIEINIDNLPKLEDGEIDMDGVLGTESGKYYKAI